MVLRRAKSPLQLKHLAISSRHCLKPHSHCTCYIRAKVVTFQLKGYKGQDTRAVGPEEKQPLSPTASVNTGLPGRKGSVQ